MGVVMLLSDELKEMVKKKLLVGYILFAGSLEAIGNLEEQVYPPGTELNGLFEVCMGPSVFGIGFSLGKRTKELKDFLHYLPDFDKTLCIIFHEKISEKDGKVEFLAEQVYRNPKKSIEYSVNAFVDRVMS